MPNESGIVADGRERVQRTSDYALKRQEIERALEERYLPQLEQAGLIRRLVLRFRKRRELERELEKLAPKSASYLQTV